MLCCNPCLIMFSVPTSQDYGQFVKNAFVWVIDSQLQEVWNSKYQFNFQHRNSNRQQLNIKWISVHKKSTNCGTFWKVLILDMEKKDLPLTPVFYLRY